MTYDVVVLGAGLAGLTCALRLADAGARVAIAATGVGAVQLAGGTVDVLGYAPEPVANPAAALPEFVAANPGHPYARIGPATISAALDWYKMRVGDLAYVGSLDENLLLPTAVGVAKPTALAPRSMIAGDVRAGGRFALVGLRELKDFYAPLAADNLARGGGGRSAFAVEVEAGGDEADVTPVGWARRFDDPRWRSAVIRDLAARIEGADAVGFPAVLGFHDHPVAWRELQEGLGAPVFEIPTLPPSVPGLRLLRALKAELRRARARLLVGSPATGARAEDGRARSVMIRSAARDLELHAQHFVLATGGFASGGVTMDSYGRVTEAVFGLPVAGVPSRGEERFSPGLLDDHPIGRAGIAVDDELRPVDVGGEPVLDNVRVAGATLAGALPWREKSGDGISVSTAYAAAGSILEAA